MHSRELERFGWPPTRIHEAISFAARQHRLIDHAEIHDVDSRDADIESIAAAIGVEAEKVAVSHRDVERALTSYAPAIFHQPDSDRLLVLLENRRSHCVLLDADLNRRRVKRADLAVWLREFVEKSRGGAWTRFLAAVDGSAHDDSIRRRLVAERFADEHAVDCWLVRRSLQQSFWQHVADGGGVAYALGLIATNILRYVVFVLSWMVVGNAALDGRSEGAWLVAWLLLLAALIPIHSVATSLQGLLSVACGFVLRQRLLFGSLRLDSEQLRADGVGGHLARVLESDAVEVLSRSGGVLALFAVIELVIAAPLLAAGAGGTLHVMLLMGWIVIVVAATFRWLRRYDDWSTQRLAITTDLAERIVGHRTRIVQQARASWHDEEDSQLERYVERSRDLDRGQTWIAAIAPRGWVVAALTTLAPSIVAGTESPNAVALSLLGTILAFQALKRFANGLPDIVGAVLAWKQVAPLSRAAAQPLERAFAAPSDEGAVLDARGIDFQYPNRGNAALRDLSLRVEPGDRVLLEGASGSGKSTLAAILAGAYSPDRGLLLLRGLDRATVGSDRWRRRVVLAPQFHDNYIFSESLAFNLLMGRSWPPRAEDWREAEEVCEELGLGPLLAQMPAGLSQMIGETGWRLSHGEQSRLFIARALLQKSELVILDETFAALDPETLQRSVECVRKRAPALLIIAHP